MGMRGNQNTIVGELMTMINAIIVVCLSHWIVCMWADNNWGGPQCTEDAECDSPSACVIGECDMGWCAWHTDCTAIACDDKDLVCVVNSCVVPELATGECWSAADCDDDKQCTDDFCLGAEQTPGTCHNRPFPAGTPCAIESAAAICIDDGYCCAVEAP